MQSERDLRDAVLEGAVKRLRPKVMTVTVMFMGLVPIMWRAERDQTSCNESRRP